jgi:hypothetical protein
MKSICLSTFLILLSITKSFAENQFPKLDSNALVTAHYDLKQLNKPYTLIIYGGVGCGWSKLLIQNLDILAECSSQCDIVLIMDQSKDSIAKQMSEVIEKYPTFTNKILQYKLKKKNDIFPQLLLFKNKVQIEHIVGVKEGMLTRTRKLIMENER